jgi:hypothetical protein
MVAICKNHFRNLATSCLASKTVLNEEFSNLFEELVEIYKHHAIREPEKLAFQDAFYCIIAQEESGQKGLSKILSS